jgi:hypothetical protein
MDVLSAFFIFVDTSDRYTLRRVLIPAKHRLDSERELSLVRLVDAACVDPEVLQSILLRLLSTKANLRVARLVLAFASCKVRVSQPLCICTPGV